MSSPTSSRQVLLSRRRLTKRAHALLEALEIRRLLSQPYVFTSTGIGGTGTEYYANINPKNSNEIYMETDTLGGDAAHHQRRAELADAQHE